jgi:hypothetical protein
MQILSYPEGEHMRPRSSRPKGHAHGQGIISAGNQDRLGRKGKGFDDRVLHVVYLASSVKLITEEIE